MSTAAKAGDAECSTGDTVDDRQAAERDDRGQFRPGNQIAKGNSGGGSHIAARVRVLRNALLDAVEADQITGVLRRLYADAIDDSLRPRDRAAAAKVLLEYTVGRPAQEPPESESTGGTFRFVFVDTHRCDQTAGPKVVANTATGPAAD